MAEEDEAVGFLAPQHQRVPLLAGLLVLRVADEHGIALALRRVFDAVLLNCPAPRALGASEIAALVEAAVLVVEAGQTTRQQVQRDRRLLEMAGIKLSGCILMQRR